MILTGGKMENKNEIGQNKPLLETHISTSKDGKYLIHKTIITDIKPRSYYKKVIEGSEK